MTGSTKTRLKQPTTGKTTRKTTKHTTKGKADTTIFAFG